MSSRSGMVRTADYCTNIDGHVTASVQPWLLNRTSAPDMQYVRQGSLHQEGPRKRQTSILA